MRVMADSSNSYPLIGKQCPVRTAEQRVFTLLAQSQIITALMCWFIYLRSVQREGKGRVQFYFEVDLHESADTWLKC